MYIQLLLDRLCLVSAMGGGGGAPAPEPAPPRIIIIRTPLPPSPSAESAVKQAKKDLAKRLGISKQQIDVV